MKFFIIFRGLLRKQFPDKTRYVIPNGDGDPGDPLFLTPYIEKGDIEHGQHKLVSEMRLLSLDSDWSIFIVPQW